MVNEVFVGQEGHRFVIVEQVKKDNQVWIYYRRIDNHKLQYNCLADAFYERFHREVA